MSGIRRIIAAIFTPPYRWLPALLFAFFVGCFALHPFSPFFTHHLADPDDYMRLDEVISWLQGQGWYDLSVPRLSPGAGTIVHWSRLLDLPIAGLSFLFRPVMSLPDSVLAAALIVPLIYFVLLLAIAAKTTRIFVGCENALLSGIIIFFAPLLLFNYTPGRVDHHGVQVIVAGVSLLCLYQIIASNKSKHYALLAALVTSCGFWIGAEALPWAILFIGCLGIAAAIYGGAVARDAALFGITLPVVTAVLIPIALPATEFSSRALSWFSPAYLLFAALGGGTLVGGWALSRCYANPVMRAIIYVLLGIIVGSVFFILIPSALHGPFTDYDTFDATTALDNISEAHALYHSLLIKHGTGLAIINLCLSFSRLLFLPIVALGTCIVHALRPGEKRSLWLVQSAYLGAATALTLFWQIRVGIFMEFFMIAPLTFLLVAWWKKLSWGLWDRSLFWAEIGVFLLLGPIPVLILPAIAEHTPFYPDLLLFPVARGEAACALEPILPTLNSSNVTGGKSLIIMNGSDSGPQILFATPHKVVSGNFDVPGNVDTYDFFHATDDKVARNAAQKWRADLVLLCRHAPTLYLGKDYNAPEHLNLQTDDKGMPHLVNTTPQQPFIQRLINGQIPTWLKPVEISAPSDYLMFRIAGTTP